MRFSLRWLLAAIAFVAVVTAAIVTRRALLVALVWYVPILATCYAIVVLCIDTNRRRAMAIGFITLTTANLIGWFFFSQQAPAMLMFRAAGYYVGSTRDIYEPDPNYPGAYRTSVSMTASIAVANGVGTLAAGLIGCLIGRLAYSHREERESTLSGGA